jgi:hypothetical protein
MSVAGTPTSGVLTEGWELYKRHWQHFLAIAFVVYAILALLTWLLIEAFGVVGLLLAAGISVIGIYLVQGAVTKAVEDVRDGRADLSVAQTFQSVTSRLGLLIVTSFLAGIAIAIGFVLLIIPGIILLTLWVLIVPAIVLENQGVGGAFRRSYELVRPYFWQALGVIALTILVLIVFGIILGIVLSPLDPGLARFISDLISGTVTSPFVAVVWTILYFRLRDAQRGTTPSPGPGPAVP